MRQFIIAATMIAILSQLTACGTLTGAAIGGAVGGGRGAATGALIGAVVDVISLGQAQQSQGYYNQGSQVIYTQVPVCRPWYGQMLCENVVVPQTVYYNNPPFNPGYAWSGWYTNQNQPGFVFFIGNDGRHHRHQVRGNQNNRHR